MKSSTAAVLALHEASRATHRAVELLAELGHVAATACAREAGGALLESLGKIIVAGLTRCSVCDAPAHASATDDLDRCATCRPASAVEVRS